MDAAPHLMFAELPPLAGVGAGWLALIGTLGVVLIVRGARMLPLLVLLPWIVAVGLRGQDERERQGAMAGAVVLGLIQAGLSLAMVAEPLG